MLYTPESHEPIESRPWDPDVALTTIREIAADCEASSTPPTGPCIRATTTEPDRTQRSMRARPA